MTKTDYWASCRHCGVEESRDTPAGRTMWKRDHSDSHSLRNPFLPITFDTWEKKA